jgi:TPR repeat protein
MRARFFTNNLASLAALLLLPAITTAAPEQSEPERPCSLAVVTHLAGRDQQVCDGKLVQEMAEAGHVFEQNQLGIASMLVISSDYSDKEALKWFERAAQKGYAPAQVNLAVLYANGWGTPTNYGAALNWLHAAAKQGFARAYTNLGIVFLKGQGVHQDYAEAFGWFQKGATSNDSDSQTNLAYMYANGFGCILVSQSRRSQQSPS